jgi:hypothetical protein
MDIFPPNFSASAQRHYSDGLLLSEQDRLPGADHFFGIAAECAIKTVLERAGLLTLDDSGKPNRPYYKHCPDIWDEYAVAHGQDASLRRLPLPPVNPFSRTWHINDRYSDGSTVGQSALEAHKSGAMAALEIMEAFTRGEIK